MSGRSRKSLLYYWTVRYIAILLLSMTIISTVLLYSVHKEGQIRQHAGMEKMVRAISQTAAEHGGRLPDELDLMRFLDDLAYQFGLGDRPVMFIVGRNGRPVQQFPSSPPKEAAQLAPRMHELLTAKTTIIRLEALQDRPSFLVASHPILVDGEEAGYALYMMPQVETVKGVLQFQLPRLTLLLTLALSGWGIIYMLTRRLVKPIREVAGAARQVVAGDYRIQLSKDYREKEVHELVSSFKEMADRLQKLESLRTQLLAGVTHELKTPITSVSGLVQAVKDGIVEGEEAAVFLDRCLKESNRLQKMVEDLLDFNSFAAGAVTVAKEPVDLQKLLMEVVEKWRIAQEDSAAAITVHTARAVSDWRAVTDPARVEQIMVNLLNNAQAALNPGGTICIRLAATSGAYLIQVEDTGRGIPEAEQSDVFEPFYRGQDKLTRVRGLGLGLPFSRLIARSLEGEIVLSSSRPGSTIFTLTLPGHASNRP
ncbi:sensor histidine kinase [Xylanibacillus composti]|uniref:histidine kinase n=1 Tax=Xylanibacillus composti TaxID=1572762 RepID=A0A8J4H0U6_9BACL|nr:HAMP domain-containing sensor histidine kinase [Xylanibacillus composti]MDT9723890.1 sensor histidine kinase [Xylanibacillus composti]GIQ67331.1 hypothetical protein XYCOK13_01550 [Xylanibacillus composti]